VIVIKTTLRWQDKQDNDSCTKYRWLLADGRHRNITTASRREKRTCQNASSNQSVSHYRHVHTTKVSLTIHMYTHENVPERLVQPKCLPLQTCTHNQGVSHYRHAHNQSVSHTHTHTHTNTRTCQNASSNQSVSHYRHVHTTKVSLTCTHTQCHTPSHTRHTADNAVAADWSVIIHQSHVQCSTAELTYHDT